MPMIKPGPRTLAGVLAGVCAFASPAHPANGIAAGTRAPASAGWRT